LTLAFVYRDAALVAVDKPAGLLSVPGRGADKQDCVFARVQALHADARVVHRLDMATSGLLVVARGEAAQRRLSDAFARRAVHKHYVAVVHGRMPAACGDIDLPLVVDWPNRPRQIVDAARGKPSLTRWRLLSVDEERDASRVELEPVTGRSHQLRVHLEAIGHPIVGDALYGGPAAPRLMLHACELSVPHPVSGALLRLESPVPF
jgi:tRNA pseudouridine32 synthase/23S rRNA pseudouridine746 synthase